MKKLLATLLACMSLTCVLVSCGDSDDDDSSSKKKDKATTSSVSSDDDEEDDDETATKKPSSKDDDDDETATKKPSSKDDDEEPTTKKSSSKDDDKEPTTKSTVKTPTKKPNSSSSTPVASSDSIYGSWEVDLTGESGGIIFKEIGKGSVFVDASEMMYTDGSSFFFDSVEISKEYINFDGSTLSIVMEGMDLMTLKAVDVKNASSYDGIYEMVSGIMYDSMAGEMMGSCTFLLEINGKNTIMTFDEMFTFTVDGNKIELSGADDFFPTLSSGTFSIDGDELTITDENGTPETLRRIS